MLHACLWLFFPNQKLCNGLGIFLFPFHFLVWLWEQKQWVSAEAIHPQYWHIHEVAKQVKDFYQSKHKSNIDTNVLTDLLTCTHTLLAFLLVYIPSKWEKYLINTGLSQSQLLAASLLLEGVFLLGSPSEMTPADWRGSTILIE